MSYLPELRTSLVKAAKRQGSSAARPEAGGRAGAWRGRSLLFRLAAGRLATGLTVGIAILVAGVALLAPAHRPEVSHRAPGETPPPAVHPAALKAAAEHALTRVPLPRGALRVSGDQSFPHRLGSPGDVLPLPHVSYVHGYWHLPQAPQTVLSFLESRPFGRVSVTARNTSTGRKAIKSFAITLPLASGRSVVAQLAIVGAPARGGGTAIRADGEAGALVSRPAFETIPGSVTRLLVTPQGLRHRRGLAYLGAATKVISSPSRVRHVVALMNQLPLVQPGASQLCHRAPDPSLRVAFLRGAEITASTTMHLSCDRVDLQIAGRPQPALTWELPTHFVAHRLTRMLELLARR